MDFNKENARVFGRYPVSSARPGDVETLIALAKQSVASGIFGLRVTMENSRLQCYSRNM